MCMTSFRHEINTLGIKHKSSHVPPIGPYKYRVVQWHQIVSSYIESQLDHNLFYNLMDHHVTNHLIVLI